MAKKFKIMLMSFCMLLIVFSSVSGTMAAEKTFGGGNDLTTNQNSDSDSDNQEVGDNKAVHVHNHAYLSAEWIFNAQTDQFISDKVKEMKKYYIQYQFNNIGGINDDGTISLDLVKDFGHWIKVSRQTDPKQKIIAWINGDTSLLHQADPVKGEAIRRNIINALDKMVKTGFLYEGKYYKVDGIQFDIEPLRRRNADDPQLLSLLKDVRAAVGPRVHLSIAAPLWEIVWSNDYISKLADVMDMLNPMMYDTQGPDSWKPYITQTGVEYEKLWKDTALRFSAAIAASHNRKCQFAPIMPAYDKRGYWEGSEYIVYHDPFIENVYHAARGLKQAIAEGAKVYGSGIFYWELFTLPHIDPKDNQDYSHARNWWMTEWVNNETSLDIPQPLPPVIVPVGQNLVQNGTFTVGNGKTFWEDWGFTVIEPMGGQDPNAKVVKVGLGEGGMGQEIYNVVPGTQFTLSAKGKVEKQGDDVQVGVNCWGSAGKLANSLLLFTGTEYETKTLSFTVVPGTTRIQVYMYKVPKVGISGYGYVTDISIKK
jgi:hypothetical protein